MNLLDWILTGVAAFSVLRGLMRGAISQLFGVAGILAGFFVAARYYGQVGAELLRNFPSLSGSGTISFILLFILTWFCISAAGFWIAKIMRSAGLGFLDRLWGGMIGFGKALVLSIAVVSILTMFSPDSNLLTESVMVKKINMVSNLLFTMAPDNVKNEFSKRQKELENLISRKKALLPDVVSEPHKEKGDKRQK